jgi:hypothetical protein
MNFMQIYFHLIKQKRLANTTTKNANTTTRSESNLGSCYKHPQYEYVTDEAFTFLTGSDEFQLDEIEVFQKE